MELRALKGTKDIFGEEMRKWLEVEEIIRNLCDDFGFGQIRTPMFEYTDLFARGVGDTTDIVNKEMYSFVDKQYALFCGKWTIGRGSCKDLL